jgi:DNA-directed RNA polymerase specialized sigma24 family protein
METSRATNAADTTAGFFAKTHWSLVMRAKDDCAMALDSLCLAYRAPLIAWLQCKGERPDEAEDQVQAFFGHLLRHDFLRGVVREKGRFRTFLLTALQNYLRDQHKRAGAAKRGGGRLPESLETTDGEGELLYSPASPAPGPDREYDRTWAGAVLASALRRLEVESGRNGHAALCTALEPVLFADMSAPAYAQIGRELGMTEAAVKMAALRIRQRLRQLIRDEVLQTVASEGDLEDELRYLLQLFARPSHLA